MAELDNVSPSDAKPEGDGVTAAVGRIEAPSRDVWQSAEQAYKSYYRWLRLKRLAFAAFVTTAALFLLWAIPWLPSGLDTEDYTPELAFTTYLLLGVALTAATAMTCQELARRRREGMVVWTSVYDEATGLRNRAYLYDRLSLECDRTEHSAGVFSILVFRVSGSAPTLDRLGELIESVIHRSDIVAQLSGRELAILSIGTGEEERELLLERLQGAVAAELSRLPGKPAIRDIQGGAATYGVDGNDPNTLVQAARAGALRKSGTQAA
ncbi:MAG: diguanylate cyclase [Chloroflexi bacterium]|nr:diguanylate cyclase [Chloroflexota bacterium]